MLQPISGDLSARDVAITQPAKLAALEGQFDTERGAPLRIGGWPDVDARRTRFAIEIPRGLSLLAFHDPGAEVKGLVASSIASCGRRCFPSTSAFRSWLASARSMALVARVVARRVGATQGHPGERRLLLALAIVTPFGFIATEAGWTVTEVGRQPWVVQGVLRTADAVTPMPGVVVPMMLFTILYIGLAAIVVVLMRSTGGRDAMSGALAIGLPEIVAGAIMMALNAYVLTGGADYGGGVWDLLARGPRRERPAPADRRVDRSDLGSEPRLADRGRGRALHRLPGRVRRARHGAAHSAHAFF